MQCSMQCIFVFKLVCDPRVLLQISALPPQLYFKSRSVKSGNRNSAACVVRVAACPLCCSGVCGELRPAYFIIGWDVFGCSGIFEEFDLVSSLGYWLLAPV